MRTKVLIVGFLVLMTWVNVQIVVKERVRTNGARLVLKLEPLDPRSLIQGDYVSLRYAIVRDIPDGKRSGVIHLKRDKNDLALSPEPTSSTETIPLKYYRQNGKIRFGIESYLFQEGQGSLHETARYAELRVSRRGAPQLIRLLDQRLQPLTVDP